jgi:hypothetical protein
MFLESTLCLVLIIRRMVANRGEERVLFVLLSIGKIWLEEMYTLVLAKVSHHKCKVQIYAVDIPRVGPGNRTTVGKLDI